MRILLAIPLLMVGACNVDRDDANDQVTLEYNQDAAENLAGAAGNTAENIGGIIANDVSQTADKVQNQVGDVDVDVDLNRSAGGNQQ